MAGLAFNVESEDTDYCSSSEGEMAAATATGIWYSFIGTGGLLRISFAATYDAQIAVFEGDSCQTLECVDGLDFSAPALPQNDNCDQAELLEMGDTVAGSTMAATSEDVGLCTSESSVTPGVWFTFTGTGQDVRITFLADFPAELLAASGDDCESLSCIATTEESRSESRLDAVLADSAFLNFRTDSGLQYYLYLYGIDESKRGTYELSVEETDPDTIAPSTSLPTLLPTASPIVAATDTPTLEPSVGPSFPLPSLAPTSAPTYMPSGTPTTAVPSSTAATPAPTSLERETPSTVCSSAVSLEVGDTIESAIATAGVDDVQVCGRSSLFGSGGVWYSVEGYDGLLNATLIPDGVGQMTVFSGSCDNLVCIDGNARAGTASVIVLWTAEATSKYLILVQSQFSSELAYELTVRFVENQ